MHRYLPYVLTSIFDPKLVFEALLVQSLLRSNIFSQTINPNLVFLAQRYTSHTNFLSLRQEVVLETSSKTCKGKQVKLTWNLHSLIFVDTRYKAQRCSKRNQIIQSNTLSLTDNQSLCLSSFFPQTIRIKKGKTTFNLVMSVHSYYFIKAFFCS